MMLWVNTEVEEHMKAEYVPNFKLLAMFEHPLVDVWW